MTGFVMYAHPRLPPRPGASEFHSIYASRKQVECSIGAVVEVVVRLAADGEDAAYWGWLAAGESQPSLIRPTYKEFAVCFEEGLERATLRGKGRAVRLAVEAAPDFQMDMAPP